MIDIGSESGFLPHPVVVPPQPITYVTDPARFDVGNVDKHSLLIAPAERHDVIIDFSKYAGKTLILYNDAPAAFPARDPRYDYYTGNADLTAGGGAPTTLPGYGPNIRTVMQIKVAAAPVARALQPQSAERSVRSPHVPAPRRSSRSVRVLRAPDRRRPRRLQHRTRHELPLDGPVGRLRADQRRIADVPHGGRRSDHPADQPGQLQRP